MLNFDKKMKTLMAKNQVLYDWDQTKESAKD